MAKVIFPNGEMTASADEVDLSAPELPVSTGTAASGLSSSPDVTDTYTTITTTPAQDNRFPLRHSLLEEVIDRTEEEEEALKKAEEQMERLRAITEKVQADAVEQLETMIAHLHPRDLFEPLVTLFSFTQDYHSKGNRIRSAIDSARKMVKANYVRMPDEERKLFSRKWATTSLLRYDQEFFLLMLTDLESADVLNMAISMIKDCWVLSDTVDHLIPLIPHLEEEHQAQLVLEINRQLGRYRFTPRAVRLLEAIPAYGKQNPPDPNTLPVSQLEAALDRMWAYYVFFSSDRMEALAPFQGTGDQKRDWGRREYQTEVWEPLGILLERAEAEAPFQSSLLLDAMIVFPPTGTIIPGQDIFSRVRWKRNIDEPLGLDWRNDLQISSLLKKLHALLGCDASGMITALTPEETMIFFRLIRSSHQTLGIDLLITFLDRCETTDEIRNIMRFFDWYNTLQLEKRGLFLADQLLAATGLPPEYPSHLGSSELEAVVSHVTVSAGGINAVINSFGARTDPAALKGRIKNLSQGGGTPLLNQVAIPILRDALDSALLELPEDSSRLKAIEALTRRMELQANRVWNIRSDRGDAEAEPLLIALGVLTGAQERYCRHYNDAALWPKNYSLDEELEHLGSQITGDLLKLPDPLDTIGFLLALRAKAHPKAEMRLVALSVLKTAAEEREGADLDYFFPQLATWMGDRSLRVGTLAAEGTLNLLHRAPPDMVARKFQTLGLDNLLETLFRSKNANDRRRAFSLLDRAWKFLSPVERERAVRSALGVVDAPPPSRDRYGYPKESGIEVEALHFIFRHRADLSSDLVSELGRHTGIPRKLLKGSTRFMIDQAGKILPFYYEIADAQNRKFYDEWAWRPENLDARAGFIVGLAHVSDGVTWSAEKRMKAIRRVAAIRPVGEEGIQVIEILGRMMGETAREDVERLASEASRNIDARTATTNPRLFEASVRLMMLAEIFYPGVPSLACFENFFWRGKIQFIDDTHRRAKIAFVRTVGNVLGYVPWSGTERVWRGLGLHSLQFRDGGNSFSTLPPFMEGYLQIPRTDRFPLSVPQAGYGTQSTRLADLLSTYGADAQPEERGRADVYALSDGRGSLVVKYVREEQAGKGLVRELQWLEAVREIGLKSDLPEPVRNQEGGVVLWTIDGREAVVFLAPKISRDYYRYLNDPSLSEAEFLSGLDDAIHDVFLLARHGVFHTVPMAAFHNEEPGSINRASGDRGKYVASPNIVFNYETRRGMGRFNNWPRALTHANFGVSGVRDLEELATMQEIIDEAEKWMPELRRLMDRPNREALLETLILGNALLTATLLVGNRLAEVAKRDQEGIHFWRDDSRLAPFAHQLLTVYATAYSVRHDIPREEARSIVASRADWLRLARQMAFFMTPAHAEFVQAGAPIADFPGDLIYGQEVTIRGTGRPNTMGPYRDQTFDPELGFIGPDGDRAKLSLGAVNGQMPVTEFEKAFFSVFLEPPVEEEAKNISVDPDLADGTKEISYSLDEGSSGEKKGVGGGSASAMARLGKGPFRGVSRFSPSPHARSTTARLLRIPL